MTVFRERLVKLLREKRMEQKELADEIKVSSRTVSAYVTGRAYPSVEGLVKIAQTLNVSTDYLLGLTDDPKGIILEKPEEPMAEDILTIRRAYRAMSERERRAVMRLIKSLVDND